MRTGDLGPVPEAELGERFLPGGIQPVTPPPTIDPPGGAYAAPVEVMIRPEVFGASLAYTFEAGEGTRWKLCTGRVTVPATGTLRARAVRYGWADSADTIAHFEIGS